MTHRHWCDYAGHYWDCSGTAVRLFEGQPSECMCLNHGVPMDEGDHSACSIELLSCPDHRDEQMRAMGYEPDYVIPGSEGPEQSSLFMDDSGNRVVGFCLWCNQDFYSAVEHDAHLADNMAACPVFQTFKDQKCMPPVLEAMFEDADLADPDGDDDH